MVSTAQYLRLRRIQSRLMAEFPPETLIKIWTNLPDSDRRFLPQIIEFTDFACGWSREAWLQPWNDPRCNHLSCCFCRRICFNTLLDVWPCPDFSLRVLPSSFGRAFIGFQRSGLLGIDNSHGRQFVTRQKYGRTRRKNFHWLPRLVSGTWGWLGPWFFSLPKTRKVRAWFMFHRSLAGPPWFYGRGKVRHAFPTCWRECGPCL